MSRSYAAVSFPTGRSYQKQPRDVLIRQREYAHDTAVITMDLEAKAQDKYAHGAPVTISWGWKPDDINTFHGYVHHTKQVQHQNKTHQLQIYCVGASYRMKQVRLRSFANKFAHQIVQQIAREHRFSLTALQHAEQYENLAQHGRSDWEFVCWLAKRIGYTFYATKTDLVFVARRIDTKTRKVPTFFYTQGKYRQRNAVYEIRHKVGEAVPGTANKARAASGVGNAGKVHKKLVHGPANLHTGTKCPTLPVFGKVSQSRPTLTPAQAVAQLKAEVELHRFNTVADATLSGNTKVHQGSTIRLAGLDADSDGLWYVEGVDHHITLTDYRIHPHLVRDQLGDTKATVGVPTSSTGKPVVITDCDVSVDSQIGTAAETVYDPVDDCVPVEDVVAQDEAVQLPFQLDPVLKRRIDKAGRGHHRKPTPARKPTQPCTSTVRKAKKKPKLTGWKAKAHTVRIVR